MKVNRPEIIHLIDQLTKQQVRGKDKPTPGSAASAGDRVEISTYSEILKKELARPGAPDASRTDRLAELARRIEHKEYVIDNGKLADIILQAIEEGPTDDF